MNPNADIFRSMYPQQAMSVTQQQQAVGQLTNSAGGPPMPSAHDSKFYSQSMQASDYPSMFNAHYKSLQYTVGYKGNQVVYYKISYKESSGKRASYWVMCSVV